VGLTRGFSKRADRTGEGRFDDARQKRYADGRKEPRTEKRSGERKKDAPQASDLRGFLPEKGLLLQKKRGKEGGH